MFFDYYSAPERAGLGRYTVRDELHRMEYAVTPWAAAAAASQPGGVAVAAAVGGGEGGEAHGARRRGAARGTRAP